MRAVYDCRVHTGTAEDLKSSVCMREPQSLGIYLHRVVWSAVSYPLMLIICVTGFPYDLRPGQRHGPNHEPDRDDAASLPLGRVSAVPGPHAAGLPSRLLGHQKQDGGTWII